MVRKGDDVWIKIKPYNGAAVRGVVKDVLTRKADHPRGAKVRLQDGRVGRVVSEPGGDFAGALSGIAAVLACAAGAAFLMR